LIAIGLARVDPHRAAKELRTLGRNQWHNGMLPHMIYSTKVPYRVEGLLWGTSAMSAGHARTSGITQPPLFATAVERVALSLPAPESKRFITDMLPILIRYHEWLYRERDPKDSGLVACLHPWECGLDDTPYWTEAMDALPEPPIYWKVVREYRLLRPEQRASAPEIQHMLALAYLLKHYNYDSKQILAHSKVVIQDLVFNSIFSAANESLERLAEMSGEELPSELRARFSPTKHALENLWDDQTEQYYSRDFNSGSLIRTPTVATFMPLYAGTASKKHAERLRELLVDEDGYNVPFPLPSVPRSSTFFEPQRYWRGPAWVNMNWFVILGLERYGFTEEAEWLRIHTLGLITRSGFREYYNPITGDGLGASDFSWTAALAVDLVASEPARVLEYE
jgi:Mannosylglycerate hydrolase MGH1-like glycoside hydrolase domain